MKRVSICLVLVTFVLSSFAQKSSDFKEIYWKEVGIKFLVPHDFKIKERSDDELKLESEDYLVWVNLEDDLDPMKERLEDEEVLKLTMPVKRLNEPTYKGEIVGFFESIEGVNDEEVTVFNILTNLESKVSKKKVTFDLSVFEFNSRIENEIDVIAGSLEFVGQGDIVKTVATKVAAADVPKKSGFASGLLKNAAKIGLDLVPGGSVAKGLFAKYLD